VESVTNSGRELIDSDHYACDRIHSRLEEIHTIWRQLKEQSERKGAKLKEANEQQQFNRNIEDVEVWITEIEGQLMSEDYGKVKAFTQVLFGLILNKKQMYLV
jgi:spectrin alpha